MTHPDWLTAARKLGLSDRPEQSELFTEMLSDPSRRVSGEGATGIGKSALVAPLALSGDQIVYSARTKSQQRQMFEYTAPMLKRAGLVNRVAMLFGRSEYICLRRAERAGYGLTIIGDGTQKNYAHVPRLYWPDVNSNADDGCSPFACGHSDARNIAVEAAQRADLAVVNHNLVALSALIGPRGPLGATESRTLVIDEAHEYAGVLADTFGAQVSPLRITRVGNAAQLMYDLDVPWLARVGDWRDALATYTGDADEFWHHEELAAEIAAQVYDTVSELDLEQSMRMSMVENLAQDLQHFSGSDIEHARYVESTGTRFAKAVSKSLVTSQHARLVDLSYRKTYYLSATLSGLPVAQLGLDDVHIGESPFDLAGRRLAYVTPRIAKSGDDWDGVELAKLVDAVGGGYTLVIATSKAQKTKVSEELDHRGYRVAMQSDDDTKVGPLVQALKDGTVDVLVGTDVLNTGIDIPGDALRLVVLLKMPVPAFKRPYEAAMSNRLKVLGYQPWRDFLDPVTELRARQGIGRLIRTVHDWGVVACLDPRNVRKNQFRHLTEPSRLVMSTADVAAFARRFR